MASTQSVDGHGLSLKVGTLRGRRGSLQGLGRTRPDAVDSRVEQHRDLRGERSLMNWGIHGSLFSKDSRGCVHLMVLPE